MASEIKSGSLRVDVVSITKLKKVAERGSHYLTPHSTIISSVKSLFILTRSLGCIKVRAINLISLSGTSIFFNLWSRNFTFKF